MEDWIDYNWNLENWNDKRWNLENEFYILAKNLNINYIFGS